MGNRGNSDSEKSHHIYRYGITVAAHCCYFSKATGNSS